ncbi:MAG TPA: hypothetical protein VLA99_14690 [Nitrospiraceae bacterium]|nr:hypothetical protein [Nitrospiraceae bacterium]
MARAGRGFHAFVLFLLVLATGCATDPSGPHITGTTTIATFHASDFGFEGPDRLPAGQTVVRLVNHGQQPHHIQLVKLTDGMNLDQLVEALQAPVVQMPNWAKHMGGPNGIGPGGRAEATLFLEPGSYALLCTIPTTDRQPHITLGMYKALTVVEQGDRPQSFAANYHLSLRDYEVAVIEPMTAGLHSFYVKNRGTQVHQVSLVRLNPGASDGHVAAALAPASDLPSWPWQLAGGMTGLEPGGEGVFTAMLASGRYSLICLFPNPNTPQSHAAKGMVLTFEVP